MTQEIWKSIPEFNGRYEVSSLGNVRSTDWVFLGQAGRPCKRKGAMLSPATHKEGYKRISLVTPPDGKLKGHLVHVLVARAFHGERPFSDAQVNHLDRDPANNRPENLQWTTPKQNVNHSVGEGAFHAKTNPQKSPITNDRVARKLDFDQVKEIRRLYDDGKFQIDIAEQFCIAQMNVSKIVRNEIWFDQDYKPKHRANQEFASVIRKPSAKITPAVIAGAEAYLDQGWTQKDVATVMGISETSVGRIAANQQRKKQETPNTEIVGSGIRYKHAPPRARGFVETKYKSMGRMKPRIFHV